MDNENNNQMNNQGYNEQPMINNQPINNQGYNEQPIINNQPMNNQSYNEQPMNNQYNNYNGNLKPKKNNKMLFIILGVVALIVIVVVALIVTLNGNNLKGNTINDYENGGTADNDNNNQQEANNDYDENLIAFKGFSIPKQIGYEYEIDATSGLLIGNSKFATIVQVIYGTLDIVKSAKDNLVVEYTDAGMNPTNVKVSNYDGKEALTMEITAEGQNALFYAIDAGSNYSFIGLAMNPTFTIDYNDIQTSVSLLSNAKYTGANRVNTDDINVIEFKNLFER